MTLCDDELTRLCLSYVGEGGDYVMWCAIYKQPNNLQSHHIDILLTSRFYSDRADTLSLPALTENHILRLLNDKVSYVRKRAFDHPLCTDELKIWYHLKCG